MSPLKSWMLVAGRVMLTASECGRVERNVRRLVGDLTGVEFGDGARERSRCESIGAPPSVATRKAAFAA